MYMYMYIHIERILYRISRVTLGRDPLQPEGVAAISELFPFHSYFSNAPQPLFTGHSFHDDWDIAEVHVHVHVFN